MRLVITQLFWLYNRWLRFVSISNLNSCDGKGARTLAVWVYPTCTWYTVSLCWLHVAISLTLIHNFYDHLVTRCNFTQGPRVANCVRVRKCACSAARALETRGRCVKPRSRQFEVWQKKKKDVSRKKRASNAYHLLVAWFSSFTGSVVCHTLPLFGCAAYMLLSRSHSPTISTIT